MNSFFRIIAAVFLVGQLLGTRASAAPEDTQAQQAMQLNARLSDATALLDEQQMGARYWEYGWGAFDTGTMIYSGISAANDDNRRDRSMDIVNATESLIGLSDVIFRPIPAFNADTLCRDPLITREEQLNCIALKEDMLARGAERAHEPYEWWPHLGNLGFNAAAGIIVGELADKRRALLTAVPGEIIGEVQLWTTPSAPMADWEGYKVKFSPFLATSGRSDIPATGVKLSVEF